MAAKKNNFLWGASTAGHQVEGGNKNQWSVWEHHNAKHLSHSAKRRLSWLPDWQLVKGRALKPSNYISGRGVDHYNRYKDDFDILKDLNLNAFRFSIEWSRLEPEQGEWDENSINHYKEYISELKKRNILPIVNLWHWTHPIWFENKGGFSKRRNIKYFEDFVDKVSSEILNGDEYVITVNEPNVYASFGYITGEWPPNHKRVIQGAWVYYNLVIAHKRAYKIIKSAHKKIQIGVAQQLGNIQAYRPGHWLDELVVKIMRYGWNWWWLNRIKRYQDFIGFNYYFTDYYKGFKKVNPKTPTNDLGWYMEPKGILPLMQRINYHFPKKPIIVTENGVADERDVHRQWWLAETMQVLETAKSQGIPVAGYLHWSLLDNFEWAYGWWPKFGLVDVNREKGMKRTIRPSAKWWADKIRDINL
jgi:beta-glucosidase